MDELPDKTIWVHCAAGYRAGIAASLLDRAGHRVVLVNDEFAMPRAEDGLIAKSSGQAAPPLEARSNSRNARLTYRRRGGLGPRIFGAGLI